MYEFKPTTWDQVKAYDTVVFNVEVDPTRKPRLCRMVLTSTPHVFKDAHAVENGIASLIGYHVTKSGARSKAYRAQHDNYVTTRISRVVSVSRHGDAPAEVTPAEPTPAPVKPLTAPMQRLVKALERHGYVDPIRDGGKVGTFVALINRGILREQTPPGHALGSRRHYPATTPAQVWDEAHAEDERRIAELEAHAACPEQWVQVDEDGVEIHVRRSRQDYPIEIERGGHRFWYVRINGRTPMTAGGTFEEARRAADRFEAGQVYSEAWVEHGLRICDEIDRIARERDEREAAELEAAGGWGQPDGMLSGTVEADQDDRENATQAPHVRDNCQRAGGCAQCTSPATIYPERYPHAYADATEQPAPQAPEGWSRVTFTRDGRERIALKCTDGSGRWSLGGSLLSWPSLLLTADNKVTNATERAEAEACCKWTESGGISTHENGCPRFWRLTDEEAAYRRSMAQVERPTSAPSLADDIAWLRKHAQVDGPRYRLTERLDRIAASARRATNRLGQPMSLHTHCGAVFAGNGWPSCPACNTAGGWQALYILGNV